MKYLNHGSGNNDHKVKYEQVNPTTLNTSVTFESEYALQHALYTNLVAEENIRYE